jgi:hypothetical protein
MTTAATKSEEMAAEGFTEINKIRCCRGLVEVQLPPWTDRGSRDTSATTDALTERLPAGMEPMVRRS